MKKFISVCLFNLLFIIATTNAATYYISPNGDDHYAGSTSNPWLTFAKAWKVLKPGDMLIVKSGTYTERMVIPISGEMNNPITIKAETDYDVTLDAQGKGPSIEIYETHDLIIQGFLTKNPGEAGAVAVYARDGDFTSCHNITLRKIGAMGGSNMKNAGAALGIGRAHHCLAEDVWTYGYGRYSLQVYGSHHITIRRAVVRFDRWDGIDYKPCDPRYGVGVYNTHDSIFENIVILDHPGAKCGDNGALYVPGNDNGATSPFTDSDNNRFYGIIALDNPGNGLQVEAGYGQSNNDNIFKDCIVWNNGGGLVANPRSVGTVFNHITAGRMQVAGWGGAPITVTNSLIINNQKTFSGEVNLNNSNIFSNIDGNPSGPNCISKNPKLKYLTRLEGGAVGKNAANDGGDMGATVLYQYHDGVKTSIPLWPWPDETIIKKNMCDSSFLASIGRTGLNAPKWCMSGKELTRYIWEYLGNTCPKEICKESFPSSK
jgi:hypothetical protein